MTTCMQPNCQTFKSTLTYHVRTGKVKSMNGLYGYFIIIMLLVIELHILETGVLSKFLDIHRTLFGKSLLLNYILHRKFFRCVVLFLLQIFQCVCNSVFLCCFL